MYTHVHTGLQWLRGQGAAREVLGPGRRQKGAVGCQAASFPRRSTFAVDGKDCKVNRDVERVLKEFHAAGKPIGYVALVGAGPARGTGDRRLGG